MIQSKQTQDEHGIWSDKVSAGRGGTGTGDNPEHFTSPVPQSLKHPTDAESKIKPGSSPPREPSSSVFQEQGRGMEEQATGGELCCGVLGVRGST
ncbi:hypothetical protein AAFF_G00043150 [Aldrovandia affinis]|uniref:Uncharacterized protein n=1 Tax=Aldrovandia affinis TaxID=143900 RepID=A0AAD7S2J7_9TELE|nr:hypothetical protein AAFF_G00043150 [Aldrovandia affinis]